MKESNNKIRSLIKYLTLAAFFYTTMVLTLSCGSSAPSLNDYINGGFEEKDSGNPDPDGWFPNRLPALSGFVKFELEDKTVHGGEKSISISISKSQPGKSNIYNWVNIVEGLGAKDVYELNGWIKTREITNSPFIEIQFWNRKQNKLIAKVSTLNQYPVTGTNNWHNVKTTFTVPEGTTRVLIIAGITSNGNSGGKVWFDDIQLKKL